MPRIEDLPVHLAKALNLEGDDSTQNVDSAQASNPPSVPFPLPPKSHDEGALLPPLPPHMESVRSHTAEEVVQMMSKTPLFMTSLEDTADGKLACTSISQDSFI